MGDPSNRGIQIQESAVGSAIVSGDGNTIYVIHQTTQQRQEHAADTTAKVGPNPYKGLAAFTEQDGDRYFGREAQVERLWQRFQALAAQSTQANAVPRLLPILGPSGCGKSSLARAGLIPELASRPLPGKTAMRVAVLVPGSHPLEALAGVLAKAATQDPLPVTKTREFTEELGLVNKTGTHDGLRRIASLIPQIHDAPLVVLVDQFEEVYSLCKDTDERQAFIDNLFTAAQDSSGQVSVVLTLRSDFLGETQRHPGLNQIIGSDQSAIVPAMTTEELRRAIAEPAKRAGHPLDAATIDLLVQDAEGREGALPLLQFALSRIWEGVGQGVAPADTYRHMGGVGGALAGKAQDIYDHLSPTEQETTRRIFIGLVQLGEGTRNTRRRVPVESLIASQDSLEAVKQVLARFSSPGARLITLSSQSNREVAEVTHEALFGHWQALNEWLDSSRDDIRFLRRLEAAAEYWHTKGRPAGLLWRSPDLDLLRTFAQKHQGNMTALDMAFFTAADQSERQEKRLRHLGLTGLLAGMVLTTGLAGFSGYQVWRAERRQIQIYETHAQNLAESDPLLSMVNGLAAIGLGHNPLVKLPRLGSRGLVSSAILDASNRHARWLTILENPVPGYRFTAHSPDGETIVSVSWAGTVQLWNRQGQPLGEPFATGQSKVWSVAFSPDGKAILSGAEDGTVQLWNHQGQPIGEPLPGHRGGVGSVAFSPDGEALLSGGEDGTVRLWNRQGQPIGEPFAGHGTSVRSVAFSPDGEALLSGGEDGTVRLWNRQGQLLGELFTAHQSAVLALTFSPGGETFASGGEDGTVRLWNRQGQPLEEPMVGHLDRVLSVSFSPDEETLVSRGSDGTVRLWNRQGQPFSKPFVGHRDRVLSVAFSPGGEAVASGGDDGTIRLWNRQGQPLGEPFTGHEGVVFSVAFSPDGNTLVSGGNDGMVRLWNRQGQPLGEPFAGHEGGVLSAAFSPDGTTLVTGGSDGTVKLWNRQGQPVGEHAIGNPGLGWSTGINAVGFSPDGQTIVSGGSNGAVQLWNRQGQPIGEPFIGHLIGRRGSGWSMGVDSVGFSPDGETIVSGGSDGTVQLWTRQGQSIGEPFVGHEGVVFSVAFSPDGETLVSSGTDSTVRLWTRQGQPIGEPLVGHQFEVRSVAFSPDGETVVSGGADGTVRLWPVWLAEVGWVSYTCDRIQGYLLPQSGWDQPVVDLARRTCEQHVWR
ncbi:hypothetical protein ACQ4N7_28590 [Nodosilinea sp. AN01ver1]|uniref:nSTAND1 domain-containing NTPase n=1 Tax=Nodosilinea sp. AN01ver1 TaxID=3423362 RepID=UPI003D310CFF